MSSKVLKCEITSELIKKGKRKYCGYCPAALAIRYAFANSLLSLTSVSVDAAIIKLNFEKPVFKPLAEDEKFEVSISCPKSLKKFITDFDKGKKVEPMSFTLRVPLNG